MQSRRIFEGIFDSTSIHLGDYYEDDPRKNDAICGGVAWEGLRNIMGIVLERVPLRELLLNRVLARETVDIW